MSLYDKDIWLYTWYMKPKQRKIQEIKKQKTPCSL